MEEVGCFSFIGKSEAIGERERGSGGVLVDAGSMMKAKKGIGVCGRADLLWFGTGREVVRGAVGG